MSTQPLNEALLSGSSRLTEVLPHVADLTTADHVFDMDFGLKELPVEPGVLIIRGPRQIGKSTWLEQAILRTIREHGPGSALYVNAEEVANAEGLRAAISDTVAAFAPTAPVRRLFIDEITAIDGWERALKLLIDAGELRGVLVTTTGSKATGLRRGAERLPGRRGRLDRTVYVFTPISYGEFRRVCGVTLGEQTLPAYLLSGGIPVAAAALAATGRVHEYVLEIVRDWIYGECAATGRNRASLVAVMEQLHRLGGTPIGQARLARQAGLANNTVAAGYLELLADLMCVGFCRVWDADRRVAVRRKPAKFPFTNLLAALAWGPSTVRRPADLTDLPRERLGVWYEWAVAQELWRRAAYDGADLPEEMLFWRTRTHELDFVELGTAGAPHFVEVKLGRTGPLDFSWFPRQHPGKRMTVITNTPFETDTVRGVQLADFLLGER